MVRINCLRHFLDPLHFTFNGKRHSIHNKTTLIVHSLVTGLFTLGVGGLIFFYVKAAERKKKQIVLLRKKVKKKPIVVTSSLKSVTKSNKDQYLAQFAPFAHSKSSLPLDSQACQNEFAELEKLSNIDAIQSIISPAPALAKGSIGQDRYSNNQPWEHTRVKLSQVPFLENDYINASWVNVDSKKKIIASQAPRLQTITAFWHMIYEYDVHNIVMLTSELAVNGLRYWPQKIGQECHDYQPYTVTLLKEYCTRLPSGYRLIHRKFEIAFENQPPKFVYHHQLPDWPDFGVIDDAKALKSAMAIINKKRVDDQPTLFHCNAGLGRTGTLIAIDQLLSDNTCNQINVAKTVGEMRLHRPSLVQTPEQYELIFQTLAAPAKPVKKQGAEADVCIDLPASLLKNLSAKTRFQDFDTALKDSDEPILKLRCFNPSKAFLKKIPFKSLYLPLHLFEDYLENDRIQLRYKQKKFHLILNQNSNTYGFQDENFEVCLQTVQTKQPAKNPLKDYVLNSSSSLYQLTASGKLEKAPLQQLKPLANPEFVKYTVTTESNHVLITVPLPNIDLKDIGILINENDMMISAKLGDSTVHVSGKGGSISLNLESEYFVSIPWKEYMFTTRKDFAKGLRCSFKGDKLKIRLPI